MLVTNHACARRVLRMAEDAAGSRSKLSIDDVAALVHAARDDRTGAIDPQAAEALVYVRRQYGFEPEAGVAFDDFARDYGFDKFVDDLNAYNEEAAKALAKKQDDWKDFAKREDHRRTAKRTDFVKKRLKKLRATPKQTAEVTVRTGHAASPPDPHTVDVARAEARKTRL